MQKLLSQISLEKQWFSKKLSLFNMLWNNQLELGNLSVTHKSIVILSLRRISAVFRWFRSWRRKKRFFTLFRMTATCIDVGNDPFGKGGTTALLSAVFFSRISI